MKKLLFVAVLGALVACGETASETPAADSTATPVDTAAAAPVAADTTVKADSTVAPAADTTKK